MVLHHVLGGFVALYMGVYVALGVLYAGIYLTRSRNVFIASRCPDMLLADLIVMTPVVLANGINLLHMVAGRDFPCWIMKAVMVPFCVNIHLVTLLRSMKLLWAFDKKWEWINAVAVSARPRVLVILCGYVVSACLVAVLTTHGACVHELCNASCCPWASDWIATWPFGMVWIPGLEILGAALGKAGADNEVLGLKNEVGRGNQAVASCMVPSALITMCMDFHWISPRVRPLTCVMALVMTAAHATITHLLPSFYLGYGPTSVMYALRFVIYRLQAQDQSAAVSPGPSRRTSLRKTSTKKILPLDIVEGPSPVTTNPMISEEAVAKNLEAALSSAELEVKAPLDFMSVLSPDAMAVFMGSVRNNEQRKQQLLDRARQFLAEDAMRFALGLSAIRYEKPTPDNRKHILDMCQALVNTHLTPQALYKLDVSAAAATRAVHEVTKLSRRRVLFQDDVNATIAAFEFAMGEVEFRLRQIAWNFIQEEMAAQQGNESGEGRRTPSRRSLSRQSTQELNHSGRERRSSSRDSTGSASSGRGRRESIGPITAKDLVGHRDEEVDAMVEGIGMANVGLPVEPLSLSLRLPPLTPSLSTHLEDPRRHSLTDEQGE